MNDNDIISSIKEKFKKKMIVISTESNEIIKNYKKKNNFNNFDSALDHFIINKNKKEEN